MGGGHKAHLGFNFYLRYDAPARMGDQIAWRYCDKCHAMFYDGYPNKGNCPAGGGHHAYGYRFYASTRHSRVCKNQIILALLRKMSRHVL